MNYVSGGVWNCLGDEILEFGVDLREVCRFEGWWLWRF